MPTTIVTCEYRNGLVCKKASEMAESVVTTTDKACELCLMQPTRTNRVTASLALGKLARPLPVEKQYLQGLLATFDPYSDGPGTELQKLISWFYSHENKRCKCATRIAKMNAWGPDKCEENMDTILRWLKHSAKINSVIYVESAVRLLVQLAIRRARKNV
jgi:hypothetical protein